MVIRFRLLTPGRICRLAISLLFPLVVIGNIFAQEKSDQKIKSETDDSWWAERAALFFPKYHFTLQATNPRIASGDNGKISAPNAILADRSWTGTTNTTWSISTNWSGGLPGATDNAVFNSTFTNQPNLTGSATVGGIWVTGSIAQNVTISASSGTLTLNGNTINGTAGLGILIDNANAFTLTISAPITLGNAQTWTNNSGNLFTVGAGGVNTNAKALTIDGSGNTSITGVLSGSGAITKTGSGTLTLSGTNTFSQQLSVQDGIVKIATINNTSANGTLGSSALSVSLGNTGGATGTLEYTGATASSSKKFTMATGGIGAFQIDTAGTTLTLSGVIDGSGALTKTGAGILALSGVNTFTGATTISAGTLSVGTIGNGGVAGNLGQATNAAANLVFDGGTLQYTGATASTNRNFTINTGETATFDITTNTLTVSGASTATDGALTKIGAGTLVLSGANAYAGLTTVSAGVLNIQNNTALGTTVVGTSVTSGATLQLQGGITVGAEALTLNGTGISSTGALRNISGVNIWQGTVTLGSATRINSDAGSLTFNTAANSITGTQNLTLGGAGNGTVAGTITTGSGTMTKADAGTWTLSGDNTYTGLTTVSAGVLNIQNDTALGTTAAGTTITTGAALQLQSGITVGAETLTLDGTGISNTGALRNISGNNSWAGLITINSTTRINSDSGTLTLDVASGNAITGSNDALQFGGAGNVTVNDVIATGTGSLTKDGAGTLTLNAANTYTGATTVSAGVLDIQNNTALGTVAGATTVADGAAIQIDGSGLSIGEALNTVTGVGDGSGALRNLANNNTWSGNITLEDTGSSSTRINSDAGTLTLSGTITEAGNANNKNLILGGTGNIVVSGAINGDDMLITKDGAGTVTLSGTNGYSGTTTVSNGTLTLDYSTNNTTKLADGSALILGGGTLNLSGGSHTEVVASTTLNAGASSVTRTSGSSVLRMNAITRNAGSTINFGAGSIANTDTDNTNGILGGYATVGATIGAADWAMSATSATDTAITAFTSYTTFVTSSGVSTTNYLLTGSAALTATESVNSLKINTTAASQSLDITSGKTLTLTSGGLMFVGANDYQINNGTLKSNTATNSDLIVQQWGAGSLTINSVIANGVGTSTLTKAGTGTLVLGAANTYTGTTFVNAGTVLVNNTTGSGTGSGAVMVNGSGTVLGGTGTISGAVTVNANAILQGGTGTTGATQKLTLSGNLTLADNSIIQLALGPSGAHSTLARTGGTWSFDSNQAFSFIDLGATAGTYDNIITGLASNPGVGSWTITNDQWSGTFSFDGANIDLNLTAVPEPATWISGILALGLLTWTQRQRFARLGRRKA